MPAVTRTVARRATVRRTLAVVAVLGTVAACAFIHPVDTAAYAILKPWRRPLTAAKPDGARDVVARRGDVLIRGWLLPAPQPTRPLVVSLHGIADNRASAVGMARASPLEAAARLRVPVLLIHGEKDDETSAEHSRRLDAALRSPHRLLLVPGAGHDGVLGAAGVEAALDEWLSALQ